MERRYDENLILIVDDSPEDYEATVRALKKSSLKNQIHRCKDGEEALNYLHNRGGFEDKYKFPKPGIILLELNLPEMDGREVLRIIKQDVHLKMIPVIVMTTSDDKLDIDRCYQEGANSYISKPIEIDKFFETVQGLHEYWFEIVVLPKDEL